MGTLDRLNPYLGCAWQNFEIASRSKSWCCLCLVCGRTWKNPSNFQCLSVSLVKHSKALIAIDDLQSKAVLRRILPLPGVPEPERWSSPWVESSTGHDQQLCRVKWYIGDTWSYMEILLFVKKPRFEVTKLLSRAERMPSASFCKAGTLIYSPDSSMCLGPNLSRLLAYLTNTTDSPSATHSCSIVFPPKYS